VSAMNSSLQHALYADGEAPFYVPCALDRASSVRYDADQFNQLVSSPQARAILVKVGTGRGGKSQRVEGVYIEEASSSQQIGLATMLIEELQLSPEQLAQIPFLGFVNYPTSKTPLFAVGWEGDWEEKHGNGQFQELRAVGPLLPAEDAAMLGLAQSLVSWNLSQKFCGSCGGETFVTRAGYGRACGTCSTRFYPRLDPAIIVLVTCGDYCLLGHQKKWVDGRYSLLAGFAEVCETLEMAVCREVFEESGVAVDASSVLCVGSQPWPFPSSLMMGFTGSAPPAADGSLPAVTPDLEEIADARWVHRSWLAAYLTQGAQHKLPPYLQGGG